jgi:hypothetical protein
MITQSGIDPSLVLKLIEEVGGYRDKMRQQLDEVVGPVFSDIERYYEGNAADALKASIRREVPKLEDFLNQLVDTFIRNVNDDLRDTQNLDNRLAG